MEISMNAHQKRLWQKMLKLIEEFRNSQIPFTYLTNELAGAFEAADFKNEQFYKQWIDLWFPLEEFSAIEGDDVNINRVMPFIDEIEEFLLGQKLS
jgi:hypothetical protein